MRALRSRAMARLWSDAERAYRQKILDSLPDAADARLVDIGCDDGAWTEELRRRLQTRPGRVAGIEIVRSRADLARARGFDVRVADIDAEWPLGDGSADVLHANQVIEHVKRLDHFVEEARRVVDRDGWVIVCTENLASWHNVAALVLGYQPFSLTNVSASRRTIGNPLALHAGEEPGLESWQHVHVLTLSALEDLFAAHGFTIQRSWGAGYHPFPGGIAARLAAADPRHAHFIGIAAQRRS
jgi:SAM-dependent methyltransferase